MIRTADTKIVAQELRARYDQPRAVTLMGRVLTKALFSGQASEVVFWALVYAHYIGGDLCPSVEEQVTTLAPFIVRDISENNLSPAAPSEQGPPIDGWSASVVADSQAGLCRPGSGDARAGARHVASLPQTGGMRLRAAPAWKGRDRAVAFR